MLARQRVALIDQLHQPLAIYMGVNLGRRDIGMAKHRLERAQVGSARQQVGSEGMAQDVRANPFGSDPRLPRQPAHDLEEANPAEMPG